MSDTTEGLRGLNDYHAHLRRLNRDAATEVYTECQSLLEGTALRLVMHTSAHYSLRHSSGWIINVHPGNRRIANSKEKPGPYLELPIDWTLLDVAKQALSAADGKGE